MRRQNRLAKSSHRELNLGYCEEAQTYCSVAEERYKQGRADERAEILKMVDWRIDQDIVKRQIDIHIDFAEMLTTENVLRIITEQLKEQTNDN